MPSSTNFSLKVLDAQFANAATDAGLDVAHIALLEMEKQLDKALYARGGRYVLLFRIFSSFN
jgi:hypothetical protein